MSKNAHSTNRTGLYRLMLLTMMDLHLVTVAAAGSEGLRLWELF